MRCRILDEILSKEFVVLYLASHNGRNRLCENAKHAVNQASINQTDVGNAPIPLCPYAEQIYIVQHLEKVLSQTDVLIDEISTQLKRCEALRQSILKKAFSGQLVPQDPNDEPASVLLERIKAEKTAQAKGSKKSKRKQTA